MMDWNTCNNTKQEARTAEIINNEVLGQAGEKLAPGPVESHKILVYITSAYVIPDPRPTANAAAI